MTRSYLAQVWRFTFTCDWCSASTVLELSASEKESEDYTGPDKLPEGWCAFVDDNTTYHFHNRKERKLWVEAQVDRKYGKVLNDDDNA